MNTPPLPNSSRAFTLIELLVVVGIIALLVAILLPTLGLARERAKTTKCLANLKGIGTGLVIYHTDNDGYVVPSYNMGAPAAADNFTGGPTDPLDGWGPILDRDGAVSGQGESFNNIFYCPNTLKIEGMAGGQTGTNPDKPRGYFDWPSIRVSNAVSTPTLLPARGFTKNIRVSYWINSDNPIGQDNKATLPNPYYTASVGYKGTAQAVIAPTRWTNFIRPQAMIAIADGVYAGKQGAGRLNGSLDGTGNATLVQDSRIGYRHNGGTLANVAFADGHAEGIKYTDFPRATNGSIPTAAQSKQENGGSYTIFADP